MRLAPRRTVAIVHAGVGGQPGTQGDYGRGVLVSHTLRIGVDFDGTMADTALFKRNWALEHFGVDVPLGRCTRSGMSACGLPREEYDRMLRDVCDRERTLAARECDGAIRGVRELRSFADLFLVTDRGRFGGWLRWSDEWLRRNGIRELFTGLLSTEYSPPNRTERTKRSICEENQINVLIDDDPANLTGLVSTSGILYARSAVPAPQDHPELRLARTWEEVVGICRSFVPPSAPNELPPVSGREE